VLHLGKLLGHLGALSSSVRGVGHVARGSWLMATSASDIEKSLTVQQEGQQVEEWLELANGCE
jgi:hypothetical protein